MSPEEKNNINGKLEELSTQVVRILSYLESDTKTNTKGLVERISDNEDKLDKLERQQEIKSAKISAFGMIGGVISVIFYMVVEQLIKNRIE
jgi:hypothetical protein